MSSIQSLIKLSFKSPIDEECDKSNESKNQLEVDKWVFDNSQGVLFKKPNMYTECK